MARVAVTGGCGFIGSHVVDALVEAGHDVTVIDLGKRPHRTDVRYVDIDMLELASVQHATEGIEHLFHLAAVANVNYAHDFPVYATALNVMGTANVLEAARTNGCKRVYLASTVWVYNGAPEAPVVDETVPFYFEGAGHIYTSTKMSAEMLCHNYAELFGLPFTILRYGVPYGPRMREELLIPIFLRKALNGEPLTVAGDGSQFRCFVYAPDLARAHVLAMSENAVGQTYNLEGDRPVTVLEVAEGIKALIGDRVRIEFVPDRAGDFRGRTISAEKARRELGWTTAVDFPEGLADTVDWFLKDWKIRLWTDADFERTLQSHAAVGPAA
ncbi:MAG: NAD-dependent epimerase/dehydratase family protein [Alphaproteobacteria bacterium]|nr:NAD-dependent epimerase/dehydratase family protein [Alphaproteobacteria bacterium]